MDEWLDAPKRNIHRGSNSESKPINEKSPTENFHLKRKSEGHEDENNTEDVGGESSGGPFNASYYSSMRDGIGMKCNSSVGSSATTARSSNRFDNSSSTFKTPFQVHSNIPGPFSSGSASQRHTGGSNLFGNSNNGHISRSGISSSSSNLESWYGNGVANRSSGGSDGLHSNGHAVSSAFKPTAAAHQDVTGPFSSSAFSNHSTSCDGVSRKDKQQSQPVQLAGVESFSIFRCKDSSMYMNGPFSSSPSPYEKQSKCIDLSGGDIKLTPNTQEISMEMQR